MADQDRIAELEAEVSRLKAGRFTLEEFQNLCHSREVQDGFEAFGLGCLTYQIQLFGRCHEPRPLLQTRSEYHEDRGDVLWWHLPIEEPPHFGSPLSSDWPVNGDEYYTHWSSVIYPKEAYSSDLPKSQTELLQEEIKRLHGLIHTPHTDDFMNAVPLEAAFQIDHWGVEHDAGKQPEDFFWLLGYLGGKALRAAIDGDIEKAKHHTISTAAACLNWFRRLHGDDQNFQPGTNLAAKLEGSS